jgi:hypothetical protein
MKSLFDAAPPRSNPASRVFRYPHLFFSRVHILNLLTVGSLGPSLSLEEFPKMTVKY